MGVFNRFRRKAMPTQAVVSFDLIGTPLARNLEAYVREGYETNPIVFACVHAIARAFASVKLEMHTYDADGDKTKVEAKHKVLDLLSKPNPLQSGRVFMQELVTWHRVAGELFLLRLPEKGPPAELYLLDPRHVKLEKVGGTVSAYVYGDGADKKRYPVNIVTGESQVLHIKTPNLSDPYRGMSPMGTAARQIDTHNAGGKWNSALLNNSARPSGFIEIAGTADETLLSRLREYFKRAMTGAANAGNMPLLTGGAKFNAVSHNPKDMDFQNSMNDAAKQVALVYGVPLPLITNEAATFNNMDTALERFWTDTVLPLLDEVLNALNGFLLPLYKAQANQAIAYNADSVPGTESKRARMMERMVKAVAGTLVTPDEARAELGFEEIGGKAKELLVAGSLKPLSKLGEEDPAKDAVDALAKALKQFGYDDGEAKAAAEADVKAVA